MALSEVVVTPILSRERFGVTEVEDMTVTSWDRAPEPVLRIMDGVQMPFEVRTTLESLVAARNATNMVDWLVSAWKANQRMMPLRELRAFIKVSMLKKKKTHSASEASLLSDVLAKGALGTSNWFSVEGTLPPKGGGKGVVLVVCMLHA